VEESELCRMLVFGNSSVEGASIGNSQNRSAHGSGSGIIGSTRLPSSPSSSSSASASSVLKLEQVDTSRSSLAPQSTSSTSAALSITTTSHFREWNVSVRHPLSRVQSFAIALVRVHHLHYVR
jgi:hypothetical protein